jgi:hypothetical protein
VCKLIVADPHRSKLAETGIDPVDPITVRNDILDKLS